VGRGGGESGWFTTSSLPRSPRRSITLLHSDLEDYVTYDGLPAFLPGAPPVYGPSDPHRSRAASLIAVVAPWVAHLTHDYGLAIYFQPYELSSPPQLCASSSAPPPPRSRSAADVSLPLNCTLGSAARLPILQVRPGGAAGRAGGGGGGECGPGTQSRERGQWGHIGTRARKRHRVVSAVATLPLAQLHAGAHDSAVHCTRSRRTGPSFDARVARPILSNAHM
jgi:hypothetical protein